MKFKYQYKIACASCRILFSCSNSHISFENNILAKPNFKEILKSSQVQACLWKQETMLLKKIILWTMHIIPTTNNKECLNLGHSYEMRSNENYSQELKLEQFKVYFTHSNFFICASFSNIFPRSSPLGKDSPRKIPLKYVHVQTCSCLPDPVPLSRVALFIHMTTNS